MLEANHEYCRMFPIHPLDGKAQLRRGAGPQAQLDALIWSVLQSVEALQQANRRILDRLRPLYIDELGLVESIDTLLRNVRSQGPKLSKRPISILALAR
ncbi:hypothetical protein [Bradyrhizobium sp.]|uniref:hypothetical protein n=1 Tax=Bradyrhizobium sp. TaxID=376 RepID=UPI0035259084